MSRVADDDSGALALGLAVLPRRASTDDVNAVVEEIPSTEDEDLRSEETAGMVVAAHVAGEVVAGRYDVVEAGQYVWNMVRDVPRLRSQLGRVVALVSDWEDLPQLWLDLGGRSAVTPESSADGLTPRTRLERDLLDEFTYIHSTSTHADS